MIDFKALLTAVTIPAVTVDNVSEVAKETLSDKALKQLGDAAFELVKAVIFVILVWFIGNKIIKFITKLVKKGLEKSNVDTGAAGFITTFVNVGMKVILIFIILGGIGVNTSSIIAVLGSAGLTAGLALQGALSNFSGGVLLLIQKPFTVGDYITACGHSGTVKKIDLFYTRLATYDNNLVVIPNGTLMNTQIINTTYAEYKLIDYKVGVDYSTDIPLVREALQAVIDREERAVTDNEHKPNIFISSFDASAITMDMRFYVKTEDYWPVTFETPERVKEELDKRNISIPFDQLDVHVKQ